MQRGTMLACREIEAGHRAGLRTAVARWPGTTCNPRQPAPGAPRSPAPDMPTAGCRPRNRYAGLHGETGFRCPGRDPRGRRSLCHSLRQSQDRRHFNFWNPDFGEPGPWMARGPSMGHEGAGRRQKRDRGGWRFCPSWCLGRSSVRQALECGLRGARRRRCRRCRRSRRRREVPAERGFPQPHSRRRPRGQHKRERDERFAAAAR